MKVFSGGRLVYVERSFAVRGCSLKARGNEWGFIGAAVSLAHYSLCYTSKHHWARRASSQQTSNHIKFSSLNDYILRFWNNEQLNCLRLCTRVWTAFSWLSTVSSGGFLSTYRSYNSRLINIQQKLTGIFFSARNKFRPHAVIIRWNTATLARIYFHDLSDYRRGLDW
jgi:hypothetical protein